MMKLCWMLVLVVLGTPALASEDATGFSFDHRLHVEDAGAACGDCHSAMATSNSLLTRSMPGHDECSACHDLDDTDACGTCHVDAEDPSGYAAKQSQVDLFNHESHVSSMDCDDCHGGAPEFTAKPAKADCRGCHATLANLQDCALCHSAGAHNVPQSHDGLWEWWHGVAAGSNAVSCTECHVQDDCQKCHGGDNVRPRAHPLNFEFSHALDAKSSRVDCTVCHTEPSYCADCHAANFVIPQTHAVPGWRSGVVHGPEALFSIESCIACHDAGEAVPATCGGSGCHQGG